MAGAPATREVKLEPRDRGKWRTPSLRNVAATAPYLHNGTAASLYDVVRRYAKSAGAPPYVDDERKVRRVELSAAGRRRPRGLPRDADRRRRRAPAAGAARAHPLRLRTVGV